MLGFERLNFYASDEWFDSLSKIVKIVIRYSYTLSRKDQTEGFLNLNIKMLDIFFKFWKKCWTHKQMFKNHTHEIHLNHTYVLCSLLAVDRFLEQFPNCALSRRIAVFSASYIASTLLVSNRLASLDYCATVASPHLQFDDIFKLSQIGFHWQSIIYLKCRCSDRSKAQQYHENFASDFGPKHYVRTFEIWQVVR